MSTETQLTPSEITFADAIAKTQALLEQLERSQLAVPEFAEQVGRLVASRDGARGFFVTYLTDPREITDQASPELVQALQASPDTVVELLVKNVVMSTAMAIYHRRQNDEEQAQGSDRVQRRTVQLLVQVQSPAIATQIYQLLTTLQTGEGEFKDFLDRWGYDTEQRQAMISLLEPLLSKVAQA